MTSTLKALVLKHKLEEASAHARTAGPLITTWKTLEEEEEEGYVRGHILHVTTYETQAVRYGAKHAKVDKPYDRLVLFRCHDLDMLVWIKNKSTKETLNLFLASVDSWYNTVVLMVAPTVAGKQLFGLVELETTEPLLPAVGLTLPPAIHPYTNEDVKEGGFTSFYGQLAVNEFSIKRISLCACCGRSLCPGPHEGKCAGGSGVRPTAVLGVVCRLESELLLPMKETRVRAVDVRLEHLTKFFIEENFCKNLGSKYEKVDLKREFTRILQEYSAAGVKFEVAGWAKSSLAAEDGAFEAETRTFHVSCLRPLTILPNVRLYPTPNPAAEEAIPGPNAPPPAAADPPAPAAADPPARAATNPPAAADAHAPAAADSPAPAPADPPAPAPADPPAPAPADSLAPAPAPAQSSTDAADPLPVLTTPTRFKGKAKK